MNDPQRCSVCQQPLRRVKHQMAHDGSMAWDAEMRTCPYNLHGTHRFEEPRHDEWHLCDTGWVKKEW
jgi:hypothetical protein